MKTYQSKPYLWRRDLLSQVTSICPAGDPSRIWNGTFLHRSASRLWSVNCIFCSHPCISPCPCMKDSNYFRQSGKRFPVCPPQRCGTTSPVLSCRAKGSRNGMAVLLWSLPKRRCPSWRNRWAMYLPLLLLGTEK